eukprot:2361270-Rhodomonas_salina.1
MALGYRLRACYAMSGTDLAYAAIGLLLSCTTSSHAMSGTDLAYAATRREPCYAAPLGTPPYLSTRWPTAACAYATATPHAVPRHRTVLCAYATAGTDAAIQSTISRIPGTVTVAIQGGSAAAVARVCCYASLSATSTALVDGIAQFTDVQIGTQYNLHQNCDFAFQNSACAALHYWPTRVLSDVRYCNIVKSYAMSGTDVAYAATRVPTRSYSRSAATLPAYGVSGTEVASPVESLSVEYAITVQVGVAVAMALEAQVCPYAAPMPCPVPAGAKSYAHSTGPYLPTLRPVLTKHTARYQPTKVASGLQFATGIGPLVPYAPNTLVSYAPTTVFICTHLQYWPAHQLCYLWYWAGVSPFAISSTEPMYVPTAPIVALRDRGGNLVPGSL